MIQYIETKSILSKLRQEDTWFGISCNMNLYRGCQHGCIYCDTRSECYGINDISMISVKKNALDLLAKELISKRKNRATIGTGSMNDPYMPIEKELQLTRNALQIIAKEKFPVHIITKSNLVERDADILQDISKTYAAVSFTITAADDFLSQKIEPYAPPSSERFKAMKLLAEKGIYTGVTLMPVLPFINDTIENITAIIEQAKEAGASYILPMFGLTLRKGSREYFYKALDDKFPGIKEKYQNRFGEQYECFSPDYKALMDLFKEKCAKLGIDSRIRFYRPKVYEQQSIIFTNQ
jgi:DNA repair photolyase